MLARDGAARTGQLATAHGTIDSAVQAMPADRIVGVLLTGMGDDGADAMCELKRCGGRTIAQDEATSVIWGMPGELVKRGGANLVLPAERIAAQLGSWLVHARRNPEGMRDGAHKR